MPAYPVRQSEHVLWSCEGSLPLEQGLHVPPLPANVEPCALHAKHDFVPLPAGDVPLAHTLQEPPLNLCSCTYAFLIRFKIIRAVCAGGGEGGGTSNNTARGYIHINF